MVARVAVAGPIRGSGDPSSMGRLKKNISRNDTNVTTVPARKHANNTHAGKFLSRQETGFA